jgi:hypothetical protein
MRSTKLSLTILLTLAVAVVAFAALELLAVRPALAGKVCCSDTTLSDCKCDGAVLPTCDSTMNNLKSVLTGTFKNYRTGPVKTNNTLTGTLDKICSNLASYGSASQISSDIKCVNVDTPGSTTLTPTSFNQNGLLFCEVTNSSHNDVGFCQFDITYQKTDLSTCVNNGDGSSTASWKGFCQDVNNGQNGLAVTGTLKCGANVQTIGAGILPVPNTQGFECSTTVGGCNCANSPNGCGPPVFCDGNSDCILNLGIAEQQGQCSTLFPASNGLLVGQVLAFSQTTQGSTCNPDTQVLAFGSTEATRYCSSGHFGQAPGFPVDCTPQGQEPFTGLGLAQSTLQFDLNIPTPTKLNGNCGPSNNDTWNMTIKANESLTDLNKIVVTSLAVEGVVGQVTCDPVNTTAVPNTRTCHVHACNPTGPDIGPIACANRRPDGSADITVTGELGDSNGDPIDNPIAIFGEQNKKMSGCL